MKKFLLSIIATISILVMIPVTYAKSDVTVYMFTKNGCPACESAREYFEGLLEEDKDAFKLVNIEVWCGNDYSVDQNNPSWILGSEDAYTLLMAVVDHFKLDDSQLGTPIIAIGDYATIGFPDDTNELKDAINKAKKSKKEIDNVKKLAEDNKIDLTNVIKSFDVESCDKLPENKTADESASKYSTAIVIASIVILVGGFAGLVVIGNKK